MRLPIGTRLGPYEIADKIGEGGMGEVYRATDTSLGRQVAIKVLPEGVATDPERLARFDREARTLAALNHPHIAHVYGLERSNGVSALIMELVEGPTLAELLEGAVFRAHDSGLVAHGSERRQPAGLPLDDALAIAMQIAEALAAAHDQGIIHRDLKPGNVKVKADGTVKVLDFGLAKALDTGARGAAGSESVPAGSSQAPTITTPAMPLD